LGHLNFKSIKLLAAENMVDGLVLDSTSADYRNPPLCKSCVEGKMMRQPFKTSDTRAAELLNVLHSDLAGPITPMAPSGSQYTAVYLDD
ncbi:hypothetical protein BD410DRAFT_699066, partial [Rickenella mellea]